MIGFYVLKCDGVAQKGPTFVRQGGSATFRFLALNRIGTTPSLTITVEHKNREDTSFVSAGSFSAITTASGTPVSLDVSALKEEIRFSYATTATAAWEGYHLLLINPVWRPF